VLVEDCMSCHGFQSKMAAVTRDLDGFRSRVEYMREAMRSSLADRRGFLRSAGRGHRLLHEQDVRLRLGAAEAPAELPAYKSTLTEFSDDALKIVYVDYDMPGPDRSPWTAHPDKDGTFWIPQYGASNRVAHFNPQTGEMKEFRVPNLSPALIPLGGACSRWPRSGLAQAGSKSSGALIPDRDVGGVRARLAQAHHCGASGWLDLVDRRAHPL